MRHGLTLPHASRSCSCTRPLTIGAFSNAEHAHIASRHCATSTVAFGRPCHITAQTRCPLAIRSEASTAIAREDEHVDFFELQDGQGPRRHHRNHVQPDHEVYHQHQHHGDDNRLADIGVAVHGLTGNRQDGLAEPKDLQGKRLEQLEQGPLGGGLPLGMGKQREALWGQLLEHEAGLHCQDPIQPCQVALAGEVRNRGHALPHEVQVQAAMAEQLVECSVLSALVDGLHVRWWLEVKYVKHHLLGLTLLMEAPHLACNTAGSSGERSSWRVSSS
mmetsp:Transcript_44707/g.143199  ORF Transcript_44707/g.143199 Transcript_44707/m.143199 type:complete len:275 (-) Transcript_44707:69-893(-)